MPCDATTRHPAANSKKAPRRRNILLRSRRARLRSLPLIPEYERAPLGRRDDLGRAVLVEIGDRDVRADAGAIVDELGHELCSARCLGISHSPIDVEHWSAVRIRIEERIEMRPEALSGYEVRHTVAI